MKTKIAVLHSQVPFIRGGAELMVENLTTQLRQRGFDAEIVGIPFKWYPENTLYDSMLAWRMIDLSEVNGEKIDLVIGTKFPSYGVQHDNKVVWMIQQFRQVYDLYNSPYGYANIPGGDGVRKHVSRYDNATLSEAKMRYTISQTVTNRAKQYNQLSSEPLYHPPALAGQYYTGESGNYILSVGRLDPLKRNDLLIRAMAKVSGGLCAKIAGKGPELEKLQKLARKLRIEDRIEFLGFVSDKELLELYAHSACVFFAPVDEDYGYITLEAFFSQKPVITCMDSGGPLEFVENGKNGFVCAANEDALAEAIQKCIGDHNRCIEMGRAGLACVKNITWDNVIQKLTQTL